MSETKQLLIEAAAEIKNLRRQNEMMAARLTMFDQCMLMLGTTPNMPSQGFAPDVVYAIEKQIASMDAVSTDK